MRTLFATSLFIMVGCAAARAQSPTAQSRAGKSGAELYGAACVSCHGLDGKGQPKTVLGFEPPATFPDFTDCAVSSPEDDFIWLAIIHRGGRVRGESHIMPAFEDILTDDEIDRIVQHLHAFCVEPRWPRGNLNFPRAFFTEKAFPENETVFSVNAVPDQPHVVTSRIDFEHRIGRRAQYEIGVPFNLQQGGNGEWSRGLGDVNAAYRYTVYDSNARGSIAAAGGEITFPTGKESEGLGGGVTIFEAFGMWDQALPRDGFVQVHAGFERPASHVFANDAVYWRTAVGKTFARKRWGRVWTPMIEVLADKELAGGARTRWDLVPQMQVSLSIFQHVLGSVGMRVPVNDREARGNEVMAYLLWDWFDGGFFQLWRAH